jgi:uncharacterized DUF497 family protein
VYALGASKVELDITWDPVKARINLAKHGVSFTQAATVLLDPLAVTLFDARHSDDEERWFTLGQSRGGVLLAVAHTFRTTGATTAAVRLISARPATRHEREQYERKPQ